MIKINMKFIRTSKLRMTLIGVTFLIISLFTDIIIFWSLIINDLIRFELRFLEEMYNQSPLNLLGVFLFVIIGLITILIYNSNRLNNSFFYTLVLILFVLLIGLLNLFIFKLYEWFFHYYAQEENESFSSLWYEYFDKSLKLSMTFYPILGFIIDTLIYKWSKGGFEEKNIIDY